VNDCQECARLRDENERYLAEIALLRGTSVAVQRVAHKTVGPQDVDALGPARPGPR